MKPALAEKAQGATSISPRSIYNPKNVGSTELALQASRTKQRAVVRYACNHDRGSEELSSLVCPHQCFTAVTTFTGDVAIPVFPLSYTIVTHLPGP